MSFSNPNGEVLTQPRTQSQLRSALDAAERNPGGLATRVTTLETNILLKSEGVTVKTNNNASPIVICSPVYSDGSTTVDLARANAVGTSRVLGLVASTSISASATGNIVVDGLFTATTAQWDAVTGQSGGLTAGSLYYLSAATAGRLTTTPPSGSGEVIQPVGEATSTVEFKFHPTTSILLR